MQLIKNKLDARLLWGLRHAMYKPFAGQLSGVGYLGKPSFVKGFNKFFSKSGLGIFPGWRIEILDGRVELGSNVRIGNNLLLNCCSEIVIGNDVTMSANVFIGTTDVMISNDINQSFHDWKTVERPIIIGTGSFVGFGAVLLPGVTLGNGCVVGANSVVRGSYPAGSIIAGERASLLRVRS